MFRSRFRDFDWVLLGFVLVLTLLSVLEIRSATAMTKFHGFQQKQMVFLGIGIVVMFLVSMVDYHRLLDISWWAYGLSILALVAVLVPHVGQKVLGLDLVRNVYQVIAGVVWQTRDIGIR